MKFWMGRCNAKNVYKYNIESIVCIFLLQNYLVSRTLCIDIIIAHHTGTERTVCVTGPIKSEIMARKVRFIHDFYMNNGPILINLPLEYIKPRDSVKFYYSDEGKRFQHHQELTCTNTPTVLPFNRIWPR